MKIQNQEAATTDATALLTQCKLDEETWMMVTESLEMVTTLFTTKKYKNNQYIGLCLVFIFQTLCARS